MPEAVPVQESRQRGSSPAETASPGGPESERGRAVVSVKGLGKTFRRSDGTTVQAVDGVSIDVHPGELVVLLGPSGCGKTTLLRCIAGLERPDRGRIEIHGHSMYSAQDGVDQPPQKRQLSMIFQSYALWPHMTAFENVAYPLRARKEPRSAIADRVHRTLEMVGIPELVEQHPGNMSGGQQQRVALARALVAGDELILFDEPLSNVDAKVREQLRLELLSMQREIGFSALYVTHDQVEAMELAHRIAVMRTGKVAQYGTPRDIYERPTSRYVANFIGTANEFAGRLAGTEPSGKLRVRTDLGEVVAVASTEAVHAEDGVALVFRPERCELVTQEADGTNCWRGTVEASLFVGSHTEHVIRVHENIRFRVWRADARLLEEGQTVWARVDPDDVRVLPAEEEMSLDI